MSVYTFKFNVRIKYVNGPNPMFIAHTLILEMNRYYLVQDKITPEKKMYVGNDK